MGEFDLIRRITAQAPTSGTGVVLGPGDDAAVLRLPPGQDLVLTTDTLVAGRHFPHDTPAADVGWKVLAVNLSDLAAMGADPGWITVALTLPEADEGWLAGFVTGLSELLVASGALLVGGDLTRGPLAVTVTAAGHLPADTALRRDRARPGDLVAVTGPLGDAALALALWAGDVPSPDSAQGRLRRRLVRPQPQLEIGRRLRGVASAAVDVSDGLAVDLEQMLAASGVGADLQVDRVPASNAFAALCPAQQRRGYQLNGGDDYELCVCVPADAPVDVLERLVVVGQVRADPGLKLVGADGQELSFERHGYDHFSR
ncbi:MAG: thiamine-phosphate kinase [Salinisphaera sp.]|nr:thiamine-phosphate kinase [Salinisphaera sp.]